MGLLHTRGPQCGFRIHYRKLSGPVLRGDLAPELRRFGSRLDELSGLHLNNRVSPSNQFILALRQQAFARELPQ